jgi:Type IV secretion-system coupling protein DNA-binding domain
VDPVVGAEVAAALGGSGAVAVAHGAKLREDALARGGQTCRVVLPAEFAEGAMEQLVAGLHGALRPQARRLLEGQPWVTVELSASATGLELRLWVPDAIGEAFVATQIRAAFPGARLEPVDDEPQPASKAAGGWIVGRGAGLLRTTTPAPGLSLLATGLRGLADGERAVVQLVVTPLPPRSQAHMLRLADTLLHGRTTRDGQRVAPTLAERTRAQRLQQKAARPLFSVSIRIMCEAPDDAAARGRAQAVASGLHAFTTSELHLARRRAYAWKRFRRAVRERRRVRVPAPVTLNAEEVAAVLAVTPAVVRELGLPATTSRQLAPPPEVPAQGRIVGVAHTASGPRPVGLDIFSSRMHLLAVGATGSGKSELLLSLATQDMAAGRSVVVIDPKGGLLAELLRRVPEERIGDVRVLDGSDAERFAGMNVLEVRPGEDAERVCDDLVGVFHAVYAASWGQRTSDILKASLLTLVRVSGSTLVELPRLLLDDQFRQRYVEGLDDPIGLGPFWAGWEALSPAARAEYAGPVLNKVRDVLLRSRLRNVLGQSRSTIDFDEILNHHGILLCDLSKGLLGEEAAALLGSLLVARIWQATRRRAATLEAERPDASLYVDEFQDLVGGATHFEEVLAQSRSLRLSVNAFTQHLDALPTGLRLAVLQNARSKIVLQTSSADARRFAREFAPWLGEADLRGLGRYEAACALAADGRTARPFTAHTIAAPSPLRGDPAPVRNEANQHYSRARAEVEAELRRRLEEPTQQAGVRFGRRSLTDRPTDRPNELRAEPAEQTGAGGESRNDYPGASQ